MTEKKKNKTLVLLDSHAILHRAYHGMPDFSSSAGEPTGALYGLMTMLIRIIEVLKPDYIAACFDLPQKTQRHEMYKEYKGTRKETEQSLVIQIQNARGVFEAWGIPMYDAPGFEADDCLGTIVEHLKDAPVDIVIASGDMDTMQLIDDEKVQVFTLRKGIQDTVLYNEKAVLERFGFGPKSIPDYKGFAGDSSDNIPGIKGIGEKTATDLITAFGSVDGVYAAVKKDAAVLVKNGFKKGAIEKIIAGEEEAQFSKMLATIRRDAPIIFELPKPWKEAFAYDKVQALCDRYEFRSIPSKLKKLLGDDFVPAAETVSHEGGDENVVAEAKMLTWLLHSDYTNPTAEDAVRFAKANTIDEAHERLVKLAQERGVYELFKTMEQPLIPVVAQMNKNGVMLDTEFLAELSKEYHKRAEQLEKEIYTDAGSEFNINSPKQLGVILYDTLKLKPSGRARTPTGARTTKESELEKMSDQHKIIHRIMEYRELQKLLGTYIDVLPKLVDAQSRLHTTFVQTGTVTGRIASIDPNLQNIPIKTETGKKIRHAFIAPKGKQLIALDYAQIELRIAAIISGDEKLIETFKSGTDIHSAVASQVFNTPLEEVTSDMRRTAKVINFGILYGMGANALKQNLGEGATMAASKEYLEHYFQKYPTLTRWIDDTKLEVARLGYSLTLFGRRRYFEGINSRIPFIRAQAERMAVNAPIQGTSADIIKLAMIAIDAWAKKEKADDLKLVLQVHDELVYECDTKNAERYAAEIKKRMETVVPKEKSKGVPLVAEYEIGDNWGVI
jgi:DNA polymerase-1